MHALRALSVVQLLLLVIASEAWPIPKERDNSDHVDESEVDARGILDGLGGSSTAAPGGLGGLAGMGQAAGGLGPMLIIGGFQALVTKFDPALVQGLPGLSGVALPTGK
jgi:hypothetical protein